MEKRSKAFIGISVVCASVTGIFLFGIGTNQKQIDSPSAQVPQYALNVFSLNSLESTAVTANGNEIEFNLNKYSAGSFDQGAYIGNVTPISGLQSISLTFLTEGADLSVSYGWSFGILAAENIVMNSENATFDFYGEAPSFFRIENNSGQSINLSAFTISYSCSATQTPSYYQLTYALNDGGTAYKVQSCNQAATSITIPSAYHGLPVESIMERAFQKCTSLASVTLPDSLTRIEDFAFTGCSALTEIRVPVNVETVRRGAFQNCTSLETVYWNAENAALSIPTLDKHIFDGCSSLTDLVIGSTVETVSENLMQSITPLLRVNFLGTATTSIGSQAFKGCRNLSTITLPEGVETIGASAFSGCTSLSSVTFPSSLTTIGSNAFNGCTSLGQITIPNGVTTIRSSAFKGCTSLTKVYWNALDCDYDGATTSAAPFYGCSSLAEIVFGNQVGRLPAYFMYNLPSLSTVNFPLTLRSIGHSAFYNCGFTSISIPLNLELLDYGAFQNCTALETVYWNASNCAYYSGATAIAHAFKGCSSLTNVYLGPQVYHLPSGFMESVSSLTTIFDNSDLAAYSESCFEKCNGLTSYEVPEGIQSLGNQAFYYCANLTSVSLPSTLKSIGSVAFGYCPLETITIPANMETIGYGAFKNTSLTTVYWNATNCAFDVPPACDLPFTSCSSLVNLTIGRNVTSLPVQFMYQVSSLANIQFLGTMSEWSAISKGSLWHSGIAATTVLCSDGVVSL